MRISTAQLYRDAVTQMQQQQTSLARIQEQIATGLRLQTAGDDPAAASRILNLEQSLDDIDRMGDNAGLSHQKLALLDDTLGELNDHLARLHELAVQSNSGTLSEEQLGHINAEVQQLFDGILKLANRQDGEGLHLFAGNDQAAAPPFSVSGGSVLYSGDQGSRQLEIAPGQSLAHNLPGSEVFQRISTGVGSGPQSYRVREADGATGGARLAATQMADPAQWDGGPYDITFTGPGNYEVRDAGNNLVSSGSYTPGEAIEVQGVRITFEGTPDAGDSFRLENGFNQDLFSTVQGFSDALANSGGSNARLSNAIYATLEDLDRAMAHINEQRASVGSRLNTAEAAQQTHDSLGLHYKESLSGLKDLDYAEASAELAQQLTALQAAQAAFVRVQGLSLFNFLR